MDPHAFGVILAGGRGERFWPLSTARRPKQVLSLFGGRTLLAMAIERLHGVVPPERVFVITSADLVEVTRAAAPQLPAENVIGEPMGRDTAAACALGMALVEARDPQGVLAVLTADHIIGETAIFQNTLRQSLAFASRDDVIITLGITPDHPSTGYGYIEAGEPAGEYDGVAFLRARRFVEKPNLATAEGYLATGRYFWNSGMFIWSTATFRRALAAHRLALRDFVDRILPDLRAGKVDAALAREYPQLERISVDYAIMEPATNIVMARGAFAWDDVGTWPALGRHFPADGEGNVALGNCVAIESGGNLVVSEGRLTALLGVRDLVVVQAEGATLICPRDRAQDVKRLVSALAARAEYRHLL